jgi:hypothetical protein
VAAAAAPASGRSAQVAQLVAFYRRHDPTKPIEQIEGIVDKRRGNAECLSLQMWAALSAAMGAKYGEELPPLDGAAAAIGASCSSGNSSGATSRTSAAGVILKGVAGGAIGKSTRKAKAPSASWVAQDLGVIGSLISAHLQCSEGGGAPDPFLVTAGARAAVAEAAQPVASSATTAAGTGGGGATAAAAVTSSDARVAVVVDELAMTIADQALGSSSLGQ